MDKLSLKSESVVEIWYTFALKKPKPSFEIPQEEWISCLKAMTYFRNIKAQYYVATFFNGDLKLYDGR